MACEVEGVAVGRGWGPNMKEAGHRAAMAAWAELVRRGEAS